MNSKKKIHLSTLLLSMLLGTGVLMAQSGPALPSAPLAKSAVEKITGPYTCQNLSIFLLHGKDRGPEHRYLTLQEALAEKKAVVHETSQVNELTIENFSGQEIYIQSGDIVKGGKQDRVLAFDLLIPPHSGRVPLASFCVEQGRWQRRGQETASQFSSSDTQLVTKDLKIAAKHLNSQGEVWKNVADAQTKLGAKLGAPVNAAQSASSLQLSLENEKVRETVEQYEQKLLPAVTGKNNVIGFACAINGKINSADLYSSHELFIKLWPKLLKASATEALAEREKTLASPPPSPQVVWSCLEEAGKGKSSEKQVSSRIRMVTRESESILLFETRDQNKNNDWIHQNYLRK